MASPTAANVLDARSTKADPKRFTSRSPTMRPNAIASENAANPVAATLALVPSES